jgi:drug/metabolite transporter (DMT)-like permease
MSRRALALFIALSIIWGTPYLFIRIAVESIEPAVVVGLRVGIAALLLLPIAAARHQLLPALRQWRWVAAFAVLEIAIAFLTLGYAEQRLTSSLTALIIAMVPIAAAIFARLLGLDPMLRGVRVLGLVIGLAGVATLVGLDVEGAQFWGVGAALITVLGYASAPMIISTKLADVPSLGVIAVALSINAVLYAPFVWWLWPSEPAPASAWWSIVVLGIVPTAIAFVLLFALIAEVGPARTTVITFINPAVAVVLGVVVLSEPVTWGIAVGFPLVLLGSFLATRPDRNQAAAVEDAPHP